MAPTIDELRSQVDVSLDRCLPKESVWPERVHAAMRYSVFAGGKRIRPLLCLAAAHAATGDRGREQAISFACAVELIHTFSLIHDDLPSMDDDDLRRGRPTCHKAFDEATAILAGDALQTLAFQIVASDPQAAQRSGLVLEALALLARACGTAGLIGGQMDDLKYEGIPATPQDIERIHRTKTGALIVATVVGGGLLGGATPAQVEALRAFADPIGLAFQIVDDILDVSSDAATLGKTPGKDVKSGKATWVALHGLEGSRRRAVELHDQAIEALHSFGSEASLLRDLASRIIHRAS
ncbi:MAG: polyprenyl synthetase family protein [Vicinamibacteria bacterium]